MIVVILSTADFDAEVWTNKQHLASRLASRHSVIYLNSMGLRTPRFRASDLLRLFRRLFRFRREANALGPSGQTSLQVINPWVLPFHSSQILRTFNSVLFNIQVKRILKKCEGGPTALWSFSPVTYGVERFFDVSVYHLVDLLHTVPGINPSTIIFEERRLANSCNHAAASSRAVQEHLQDMGFKSPSLLENVGDVSLFSSDLERIRTPRAVYFGNLTPTKVDFQILNSVCSLGIQTLIAGPEGIDGSSSNQASQLSTYRNLIRLETVHQKEMADICQTSMVGLVPYVLTDHTAGIFPMKIYEYLAAGLEVVSTKLPSLGNLKHERLTLVDQDQFAEIVREKLINYLPPDKNFMDSIAINSWETRVRDVEAILQSLHGRNPGVSDD